MIYIHILVLGFGVLGCNGNHKQSKCLGYDIVGSDYREREENIIHPCPLNNLNCMRYFLSKNSQCAPVTAAGFHLDPIILPIEKFNFPVSSMATIHLGARVRGLRNAKISRFSFNKATGNVVIAVTIPTYNFTSYSCFMYQRVAKETISMCDFGTFEVDNLILTATIPKLSNLKLSLADIHAYTHDSGPRRHYIGPKAYTSNDPEVKCSFAEFNSNIVTIIKEVYVFHSYLLMTRFIQDILCNFGVDSYRNYNGYALGKCYPETAK